MMNTFACRVSEYCFGADFTDSISQREVHEQRLAIA